MAVISDCPHYLPKPRGKLRSAGRFSRKQMQQMCQKVTESRLFDKAVSVVADPDPTQLGADLHRCRGFIPWLKQLRRC
jgi:hypothetical protein